MTSAQLSKNALENSSPTKKSSDFTAGVPSVEVCVEVTSTNDPWFGAHVKEQKKDLKLFRHAGQEPISASTTLKFS